MPQQNWHHFLLQSNKASWKVNVLVKFCGWRQEIIEPYEKTAGSRMKTLQRKTWTVTMKIFIQHIIKLAFERSPPQNFAVGRERGSYRYPAHRHCLRLDQMEVEARPSDIPLLCQGRWTEAGRGHCPSQIHFSSGRMWAFWILFPSCTLGSGSAAPLEVSILRSVFLLNLLDLVTIKLKTNID